MSRDTQRSCSSEVTILTLTKFTKYYHQIPSPADKEDITLETIFLLYAFNLLALLESFVQTIFLIRCTKLRLIFSIFMNRFDHGNKVLWRDIIDNAMACSCYIASPRGQTINMSSYLILYLPRLLLCDGVKYLYQVIHVNGDVYLRLPVGKPTVHQSVSEGYRAIRTSIFPYGVKAFLSVGVASVFVEPSLEGVVELVGSLSGCVCLLLSSLCLNLTRSLL